MITFAHSPECVAQQMCVVAVFARAAPKRGGEKAIIKWKEEEEEDGNKRGTCFSNQLHWTGYPLTLFLRSWNCSLFDDVIFNLAHRPEPFIISMELTDEDFRHWFLFKNWWCFPLRNSKTSLRGTAKSTNKKNGSEFPRIAGTIVPSGERQWQRDRPEQFLTL